MLTLFILHVVIKLFIFTILMNEFQAAGSGMVEGDVEARQLLQER